MKLTRTFALAAAALTAACVWGGSALAIDDKPAAAPAATPAAPAPATSDTPKPADAPADKPTEKTEVPTPAPEYVKLTTSLGEIVLELDAAKAPITVKNFLSYVDKKYYDGTIFHRVIPGFMIQGGGFTSDMTQKPTDAAIKNEGTNGLKNARGTIAMARTQVFDSATSQFFINVVDNRMLDNPLQPYAVFGKVVSGMDVADKIVNVRTANKGMHQNVPVEAVTIVSATRTTAPAAAAPSEKK
jgi:peptidyl-prolyl cis-trans isomerase A (cyclophilin A)